jgi:hypothetical protein
MGKTAINRAFFRKGAGGEFASFRAGRAIVDFWRKSNKPPFDSLQSFLGLHFPSRIIAWSALSPDLMKNHPVDP